MYKKIFTKKNLIFLAAILFIVGGYWFFYQLFPAEKGEWNKKMMDDFSKESVLNFGLKNNDFWWVSDFPGEQNVCLEIQLNKNSVEAIKNLPIKQTVSVAELPEGGSFIDLVNQNSVDLAKEKILNGNGYLLTNLEKSISREGKNLFLVAGSDKFLFPTVNIFNYYFPSREIPESSSVNQEIAYSNKLIHFPDGILLSRGEGAFTVSGGKLILIRSPEIFEAMGYNWAEVKGMTNFEKKMNAVSNDKTLGFDFIHPNGTIVKKENGLFLVWEEKLFKITEEERDANFLFQPIVEAKELTSKAECAVVGNKVNCCVNNFDPRLNAPANFPFSNTLFWNLESISPMGIEKIGWSSEIVLNEENIMKRLISFQNYFLYTTGIKK